ncbi:helix-turn-helix transcriptional regulator [Bacteroides sp. GD17]|uniref:helix-turn-helix transcriptional regulator n=2 Tax=Bacteroides TaxID=816 RepID=UPI00313B40DC
MKTTHPRLTNIPTLIVALLLLLLTACQHRQRATSTPQHYTADTLTQLDRQALQSPQAAEEVLQQLDQLHRNSQGPLFKLEWVEGNILMRQQKYLQAAEAYRNALATDSVQATPQYYINLCKNIMLLYHRQERMDSAMYYADLLLRRIDRDALPERAKQDAYWCMSQIYHTYGDTLNRNETARKATQLAWLTLDERIRTQSYMARALNNLFNIYSQNLDYALQENNLPAADTLAQRMQWLSAGLDTLVLGPHHPDGIPQWTLRENHHLLCHQLIRLCHATNHTTQERQWIKRLEADADIHNADAATTTDAEAADAQLHLAECYIQTRRYDRALPLLSAIRHRYQQAPDSISQANADVCRQLSEALQALDRPAEALLWQRRSETLQDSLRARSSHSEALQLAAISHISEQRLQIDRQQSTISRQRTRLILLAVLSLLISIVAAIVALHLRKVKRRNIEMVRQIKQQQKLNKELQPIPEPVLYSPLNDNELPQWLKEKEEKLDRQYVLQKHFSALQTLMQEEKPYLHSDLKPSDICTRLDISAAELNAATQEMAQLSLGDYINHLRLEHALFLLESSEYIKIAVVAEESGFGSARHFYRLFQKEYNMSPADYRNGAKGMNATS